MRALVVIPHAYLRNPGGIYGSERTDEAVRAAALVRCVSALHQSVGVRQHIIDEGVDPACNAGIATGLEVVLVTAGDAHLARAVPRHLAHHHNTALPPRQLGFACQEILRGNAGRYDWYGYLEDDCEIADPLLLTKLAWFNGQFGPDALLQPNRFEISAGPVVHKLYIDGRIHGMAPWVEPPGAVHLEAAAIGQTWRFRRVSNPHAGCFFVDRAQMGRLAADPAFGHYSEAFMGPLESAATLPVLRNFAVYKPALANAGFLEMRHIDQRLLDQTLSYSVNESGQIVRRITAV